jgi:hypothetical protein
MKPLICVLALTLSSPVSASADEATELQLTLPAAVYAVPDLETGLYFDNIVLPESSSTLRFKVSSDIGESDDLRWVVTPADTDVGRHSLTVAVHNQEGELLAEQSTVVHVVTKTSESERHIKLLIIGDSLTHASAYPNEVARLLNQPGNPGWTMLGTHKPTSAAEGVAHEGYVSIRSTVTPITTAFTRMPPATDKSERQSTAG